MILQIGENFKFKIISLLFNIIRFPSASSAGNRRKKRTHRAMRPLLGIIRLSWSARPSPPGPAPPAPARAPPGSGSAGPDQPFNGLRMVHRRPQGADDFGLSHVHTIVPPSGIRISRSQQKSADIIHHPAPFGKGEMG